MEKQRNKRKFKFCTGLLKSLIACTIFIFSLEAKAQQRLTYSMIMELNVKSVNQINFSGTDSAFELKIPYTKSDFVQAQIPDLPQGVTFVSLRRSEYSDENKESGTKIELWLNFADAGTYRMRSLNVFINSKLYFIKFENENRITIAENPRNILPQLVVSFDNGYELISQRRGTKLARAGFYATAGKPMQFTIQLQYAVQIISYNWVVPKNALVRELQQFDITKGTLRSSEFSEEKIPVATFEWEPLYAGDLTLPELHIIATSYNGTRVELMLPETLIPVLEDYSNNQTEESAESYFGYAFVRKTEKTSATVKTDLSSDDCQKIAGLRYKERHSVPFSKAYKMRKEFEESKGIYQGSIEPTYFVLWTSVLLIFVFLGFDLIAGVKKRLGGILLSSGLVVLFFVSMMISLVQLSREFAIFKSGNIRSVPEETSKAVISIESGKRVLVEQKAGEWIFVRFGTNGGWVKEENVIYIGN